MFMEPESFQHKPLANLLRGVGEESEPVGDELKAKLRRRGLDSEEVASQIEGRVSAFLQRQRSAQVATPRKWKHPSVRLFAAGKDPIQKMISITTDFALMALEAANQPAVDPFLLAELKHIPVIPNDAISDARLIPFGSRFQIEFNPNQPKSRIRFSVAHELAHTFFEDCHQVVRNRLRREEFGPHDWELEMLCNIGAAELLMPIASFPDLRGESLNIDSLRELRSKFEVSSEALLARIARITREPCSMFAASCIESGHSTGRYRIDYMINSRSWHPAASAGELLSKKTTVSECTAIGFTAKGDELWPGAVHVHIECVGVLPYRGARFPRVVGIVRPLTQAAYKGLKMLYVKGDATQPRGSGPRVIAFIVNDKAISWGKGVSRAVAQKWPHAQRTFTQRVLEDKSALRLGNTFHVQLENDLWAFQMVCQHGYGPSALPRIRYGALKSCLDELVHFAVKLNASVHIPRLGSGEGAAPWSIVSQIVDETLCRGGVPVTVYDLPNARPDRSPELPGLFKQ